MLSEDEASSLILGGDDHIRIQLLSPGLNLDELWARMDRMDDYVNERFSYAFDDKYGYLTSFPTNVGTEMCIRDRVKCRQYLPIKISHSPSYISGKIRIVI